jgi:hypothetical protein
VKHYRRYCHNNPIIDIIRITFYCCGLFVCLFVFVIESVILRALVGNPNRHKPLADHRIKSQAVTQEINPAAMYVIETSSRPIPVKALPPKFQEQIAQNSKLNEFQHESKQIHTLTYSLQLKNT